MYLLRFENGAEIEIPAEAGNPSEIVLYHTGCEMLVFAFRLADKLPSGNMLYLEAKNCLTPGPHDEMD
jgi:hypothetical protein